MRQLDKDVTEVLEISRSVLSDLENDWPKEELIVPIPEVIARIAHILDGSHTPGTAPK